MAGKEVNINSNYEKFYSKITNKKVYPTEFVVRTFLANYPDLKMEKPKPGDSVLDIAFGDGRNTVFLCEQGYNVSGIEITKGIVELTGKRLKDLGLAADLRIGRNNNIPFEDNSFDYILASHCMYYCDDGDLLSDNLKEYARVLKPGGYLIGSVANSDSYIFEGAEELSDGSKLINNDPYNNRDGYRLFAFKSEKEIEDYFSDLFNEFSIGFADNNFYGIRERVFWITCKNLNN